MVDEKQQCRLFDSHDKGHIPKELGLNRDCSLSLLWITV
jgi:hypothetical protein